MIFVDTNYFLRFFLADVTEQQTKAKQLFIDASEGKVKLFTSVIVIFEVYWVILGQFKKEKKKVGDIVEKLFKLQFLEIENLDLLKKALAITKSSNIGLVDSYNLVYAKSKNASDFKTFDKALLKKLFK